MKKLLVVLLTVSAAIAANAQAKWQAGQGIANDHAAGANARDVTFVARDAGNGYGYRQYTTPIGLTVLPWSLPNFESFVYGLRLNFGWGGYAETYGIDGGLFSSSREFGGIALDLFGNYVTGGSAGLQAGLVNVGAEDVYGLQVGGVNFAGRLHGVQIGFLNFNRAGIVLPLINVGL